MVERGRSGAPTEERQPRRVPRHVQSRRWRRRALFDARAARLLWRGRRGTPGERGVPCRRTRSA